MGEDVPVRWFNFEKVVEALVQQKTFYLKVSQLYNVVRKMCFMEDELEMMAMLDFYHDLGIIIWHGDTVVLQTQWLIHLFRKLITIRPFDEQVIHRATILNQLTEARGKQFASRESPCFPRRSRDSRELMRTTTTAVTRTSPNEMFNEQHNSCARAL